LWVPGGTPNKIKKFFFVDFRDAQKMSDTLGRSMPIITIDLVCLCLKFII